MNLRQSMAIAAMACALAGGLAGQVQAAPLTVGSSLLVGGEITVTVLSCSGSGCGGEFVSYGYNGIKIQGAGGGVFNTGAPADTTVGFSVQDAVHLIYGVGLSVNGFGFFTNTGENVKDAFAAPLATLTADAGASSNVTFAGQSSIRVLKDIASGDFNFGAGTITVGTTNYVTQTFAIPEPASIGLLVFGMASLASLRRRKA